MRYTERKHDREINDLFDLVTFLVVTVFLAPYRMLSEIGNKLMYLGREAIEKLIILTVSIITFFVVWDGFRFVLFSKLDLTTGFLPLTVKFSVLAITGLGSLYVLNKFNSLKVLESSIYEEGEEFQEDGLGILDESSDGPEYGVGEAPQVALDNEGEVDIVTSLEEDEQEIPEVVGVDDKEEARPTVISSETIELGEEEDMHTFDFVKELSPEDILSNLKNNEGILTGILNKPVATNEFLAGNILLSDKNKEDSL